MDDLQEFIQLWREHRNDPGDDWFIEFCQRKGRVIPPGSYFVVGPLSGGIRGSGVDRCVVTHIKVHPEI